MSLRRLSYAMEIIKTGVYCFMNLISIMLYYYKFKTLIGNL